MRLWFKISIILVLLTTSLHSLAIDTVGLSFNEMYLIMKTTRAKQMIDSGFYNRAINTLQQCTTYIDNDIALIFLTEYYFQMSQAYRKKGDLKNAFNYYYDFYEKSRFIYSEAISNNIANLQNQRLYDIETELADKRNQSILKQHNLEQRKIYNIIYIVLVLLAIILLSFGVIFKMFRVKRKYNKDLETKNKELALQRTQIQQQCNLIEQRKNAEQEANNQIVSSIHYAERIQQAVIQSSGNINPIFQQSFVYYRPKNIVSGDFYVVLQCGKYKVLVVADCTGHGIPGGFLSMLGISAVKEFFDTEETAKRPGIVLDKLKTFVKDTLNSRDDISIIEDGMDMTICSFDFETHTMYYATANQTAIIVRNGKPIKIKGDNMPLGNYYLQVDKFSSYSMPILPNDMVYLYSDGFQDQLGGDLSVEVGQKLYSKNFINFLCSIANFDIAQQEQKLDAFMQEWINGREQTDDMTMVAIKVI